MARVLVLGGIAGGIYGLLAIGIVLVYRGSRVLNFAQAEIGTFALYVAWWLTAENGELTFFRRAWTVGGPELPWLVGAFGAVAVAALIGIAFERLVVSRMADAQRLAVAVGTVGLLFFVYAVELKMFGPSPRILPPPIGGSGVEIAGVIVSPTQILALVVVAALGLGLAALLRTTDFGLGVLAAAEDPVAVRLVGVRLWRVQSFTWGLGAALSAIALIFIAPTIGVFAPGFAGELFVKALAAALIGGLVSLPGAFVGGLVVGFIDVWAERTYGQSALPGIPIVVMFLVIVAVMLFRPQGLLARRAT